MQLKMRQVFVSASLISFYLNPVSASGLRCAEQFYKAKIPAEATSSTDTLRQTLPPETQAQIAKAIRNLTTLRLSLNQAKPKDTSSIKLTDLENDYSKKEQALVTYLETHKIMTRDQLFEKLKQDIQKIQSEKQGEPKQSRRRHRQEEQIKNSVNDEAQAVFHKVQPGSFTMGDENRQVHVTLTKMPEIMAFHTTQIIYKTIAELANNKFPEKYQIDADPSNFKGDTRPVEKVSHEDAEKWVNALNDLSDAGEPALLNLFPDHKKGMRYEASMTEAQREYLMKKARTEDGDSIDEMIKRNDTAKLKQYFAFDRSSSEGTIPVDQLKPLFVDGKPFYGLSGNAWELTKDTWASKGAPLPIGGTDPVNTVGYARIIRGGSWAIKARELTILSSSNRYITVPRNRYDDQSFRLVRTTP